MTLLLTKVYRDTHREACVRAPAAVRRTSGARSTSTLPTTEVESHSPPDGTTPVTPAPNSDGLGKDSGGWEASILKVQAALKP